MRRSKIETLVRLFVAVLFVLACFVFTTFTPHELDEPDPVETTVNPAVYIHVPVPVTPSPWLPVETEEPNVKHEPEPDPTETPEPEVTGMSESTEPVASEPTVETAVYYAQPPYWLDEGYTSEEIIDYLKREVIAECGGEPLRGIKGVVQVIYDRTMYGNGFYGNGIIEVLKYPGAFAKPYEGDTSAWDEKVNEAIFAVWVQGERVWDKHVFYFYNPDYCDEAGLEFMESQQYVERIGNHIFATRWGE